MSSAAPQPRNLRPVQAVGSSESRIGRMSGVDFSRRLIDNFFRRWYLYLLPVLLFGVFGAYAALQVTDEYQSGSVVDVSRNPLVEALEIRGTDIASFETPASGTARLIQEQLGTKSFLEDVATRAGLVPSLEAGLVSLGDVNGAISPRAQGASLLRVRATWDEPQMAAQLVAATIAAYQDHLASVVAADSLEAISFWEQELADAETELTAAESELRAYLESLPPEQAADGRTPDQELVFVRLTAAVESSLADVTQAREAIDQAELSVQRSRSEAGAQVRVVDPPEVPGAPEPVRRQQVLMLGMFTIVGLIIAGGILFLTTVLDRSVRSTPQLSAATGMDNVVTLPYRRAISLRRGGAMEVSG